MNHTITSRNQFYGTILIAVSLCLFSQQPALSASAELAVIPVIIFENTKIQTPECKNIKSALNDFSLQMGEAHNKLSLYLSQISSHYILWHRQLTPYENTEASWIEGYFLPLISSASNIETSKDQIYIWSSGIEDFFSTLEVQLNGANCVTESEKTEEALEKLSHFISIHSEHISAASDFLSRMQARLVAQSHIWQKLEGIEFHPIQSGSFLFLKSESELFLEAAQLVQANSNYVREEFLASQRLVEGLFLPLAPKH